MLSYTPPHQEGMGSGVGCPTSPLCAHTVQNKGPLLVAVGAKALHEACLSMQLNGVQAPPTCLSHSLFPGLLRKHRTTKPIFKKYSHCPGVLRFFCLRVFGSVKTDLVRLKWGFGGGTFERQICLFEAFKNPIRKRRKVLAERPYL